MEAQISRDGRPGCRGGASLTWLAWPRSPWMPGPGGDLVADRHPGVRAGPGRAARVRRAADQPRPAPARRPGPGRGRGRPGVDRDAALRERPHRAALRAAVGPGPGALVIAQVAAQQPDPGWLSEAAARIGTTLDLSTTANEAVDVAVPGFADAAAIFVAERLLVADEFASPRAGHGAVLRRLAARLSGHPAAVTEDLLRPGEVLVFAEGSPSYRAMTTSTPMLFDQLDDETAERIARHPGGEDLVGSFTSFLAVPLVARGAVLGCATFGRASSSSPFGPADIAAAGELASRAAVCIDNARLYDRERRTAQALQRGMLPGQPDVPASMEVARCYVGVGGSVVGGDWHDIVTLPSGKAVLVVGDAMGHGPEAAAVMVQLRTAAHTLADVELAPERVLARLDRMAAGLISPFATCIYTVIDPATSSCVTAQAGHLPPVLVLASGETQVLELPPGLPLGLGAETFESTRISLPPGRHPGPVHRRAGGEPGPAAGRRAGGAAEGAAHRPG